MKKILSAVLAILLILAAIFGPWLIKRWWNNTLFYNSSMESVVCEMVDEDYLTDHGKEICN